MFNQLKIRKPFVSPGYKVVSLQVVSIRTQAVKLHKNFDHFKKSWQLKKIWLKILRSLSQARKTIYTSKTLKELTCIETTGNRKFERLGLAFTRNHLNRTRMQTSTRSKFRVNRAKLLNGSLLTKQPAKLFNRLKIRPLPC